MIDGRYSLEEQVGVGGMASVWRATDTLLGRRLAIKRLSPHLKSDSGASERFRREGQAAAGLNHPGIVTVFDAGEDEDGFWIAMELIEGETVADRLAANGPLDLLTVTAFIEQVAAAVDYAHENGIVHRDIKPANLLIEPGGRIRLADFGIAKPLVDPATITSPGQMVGTISYVAPEIISGEAASPASDIYSLGAVTYEMLTGERPFNADTTAGLLDAIRHADGPDLAGKVPIQVIPALSRAMSRDPVRRPSSARAFAAGLAQPSTLVMPATSVERGSTIATPLTTGDPDRAGTLPPETGAAGEPTLLIPPDRVPPEPAIAAVPEQPGGKGRRRGRAMVLAGAAGLLIVVAAVSLADRLSGTNEPASSGSTITSLASATTVPAATVTTTNTTAGTEATSAVGTPGAIAAEITRVLAGLGPPDYKPKDVRELQQRVDRSVAEWEDGNAERSAESLQDAFESVERLPASDTRAELLALLTALAGAMDVEEDDD